MAGKNHPTGRQRSGAINQRQADDGEVLPQLAAVQGQKECFAFPIAQSRADQTAIDRAGLDPAVRKPAGQLVRFARDSPSAPIRLEGDNL